MERMKSVREVDLSIFKPRKAWDSNLINYLSSLKYYFIVAKLGGLNDFPHKLLKNEVSSFGEASSKVLCLVSLAMSLQAVIFFCAPSMVPDSYLPLKLNVGGNPFRYLLPLVSISMTMLRYRVAVLLSNRTFLAEIRQIALDVIKNPVLCRLRVQSWKVRAPLCATLSMISYGLVTGVWRSLSARSNGWKSLGFYASVLEIHLYVNVDLHVACYVLITGLHVVLPLLRLTLPEFEEAAKTMDHRRLDEAIKCHETCCRLIEALDGIASFFFGSMLVTAVPQIALTIGSLDRVSENNILLRQSVMYFTWQAAFVAVFLLLASKIHQQAHKPQEILSSRVYGNKEFESLSSQFIKRLDYKTFGLTFFGVFTFKKITILTVLNIITTYLIVALQMKHS